MIELYSKPLQIEAAGPFAISNPTRSQVAPERKTMKLMAVPVISGVVLGEGEDDALVCVEKDPVL